MVNLYGVKLKVIAMRKKLKNTAEKAKYARKILTEFN